MRKKEWKQEASDIKPGIRVVFRKKPREPTGKKRETEGSLGRGRMQEIITRTERIPLLDSSSSSSTSEAEAKQVLETLHLRFQAYRPSPVPTTSTSQELGSGLRQSSLQPVSKDNQPKRSGKGRLPGFKLPSKARNRRTISKDAFLFIGNRQEVSPYRNRPTSAVSLPIPRRFPRPNSGFHVNLCP